MPDWVEYLLRMLMAVGLGFIIGIERQLRLKVGGIRTHAVVSAGACLFMLISKYGFTEGYDAARIAAQVVSGISFIGAGMILHRQQVVHGLTSAAGIWLTAGIGMAAGAGMYYVALGSTVLILAVQCIMHIPCKLFKDRQFNEIKLVFTDGGENQEEIKKFFNVKKFSSISADRQGDDVVCTAFVRTEKAFDDGFVTQTLKDYPFVLSIRRTDGEG